MITATTEQDSESARTMTLASPETSSRASLVDSVYEQRISAELEASKVDFLQEIEQSEPLIKKALRS